MPEVCPYTNTKLINSILHARGLSRNIKMLRLYLYIYKYWQFLKYTNALLCDTVQIKKKINQNFSKFQVTQYNCDFTNKAPQGCLQYFFGNLGSGSVRSFNFAATIPYHLANQKQSICVRQVLEIVTKHQGNLSSRLKITAAKIGK